MLIFGGSQGAKAINSAVIDSLPALRAISGLRVTHQTGAQDLERVRTAYERAGLPAEVVPFLYDMPAVLRSADLIVARAGGMTVAELTVCGKPAILVPLPTAIYNHQALNAAVMESAGADGAAGALEGVGDAVDLLQVAAGAGGIQGAFPLIEIAGPGFHDILRDAWSQGLEALDHPVIDDGAEIHRRDGLLVIRGRTQGGRCRRLPAHAPRWGEVR